MNEPTPIRYEVISQQQDDNVLIPVPPRLLEQLGWKPGDTIKIDMDDKGRFILLKG